MLAEVISIIPKIRSNTATVEDYKRYEEILTSTGKIHSNDFYSILGKCGCSSYEQFIKDRNMAPIYDATNELIELANIYIWSDDACSSCGDDKPKADPWKNP